MTDDNPVVRDDLPDFMIPMLKAARDHIEKQHPLMSKVGIRARLLGRGDVQFEVTPTEDFLEDGVVHGGFFTVTLDTILGYAVWTSLDQFEAIATINLKTDYLADTTPGTRLICTATCLGIRDDVAFCSGRAEVDGTGEVIATAQATFMVGTKSGKTESRL